ncbi:MAG: hypothetical protein QM778_30225 [Myxococcales bacterium]
MTLMGTCAGVAAAVPAYGLAQASPWGSACANARLEVVNSLPSPWLAPVVEVCERLETMKDVDPSAHLRIVRSGEQVVVEVSLLDGRSALRRVRRPEDLQATVEALVVVPPDPPQAVVRPVPVAEEVLPKDRPAREPPRAAGHAAATPIELGVSAMGRLAGTPIYLSAALAGYGGVRVDRWLLAMSARWEGFQTLLHDAPPLLEMSTVGGGFLVLRRLVDRAHSALELGGTSHVLGTFQSAQNGSEHSRSNVDVRVGTVMRLRGVDASSWWLALDAECSPWRSTHPMHSYASLPALPSWSLGLAVGVVWEAR